MFHYKTLDEVKEQAQKLGVQLPFAENTDVLCQPLTLPGHTLPNRMAIHPMEGCDGTPDGKPDRQTLLRYDRFARSGAGLIWLEAVAVCPEGRANPRQLWINEQIPGRPYPGALRPGARLRPPPHHAGHPLRPLQQTPGHSRPHHRLQ